VESKLEKTKTNGKGKGGELGLTNFNYKKENRGGGGGSAGSGEKSYGVGGVCVCEKRGTMWGIRKLRSAKEKYESLLTEKREKRSKKLFVGDVPIEKSFYKKHKLIPRKGQKRKKKRGPGEWV